MLTKNRDKPMHAQLKELYKFSNQREPMWYNQYYAGALQSTKVNIKTSDRQWMYQMCTQLGLYQTPNKVFPLRSQLLKRSYWPAYCKRVFGKDLPRSTAHHTVRKYKGVNNNGKNIYFSNASEDPWQTASILKYQNSAQRKNIKLGYMKCDDCGHCADFHTPADEQAESLTRVQKDISDTILRWLSEAR